MVVKNISYLISIEDNIKYPNSCSIVFSDNTTYTTGDNSFDILKQIIRNKKLEELLLYNSKI